MARRHRVPVLHSATPDERRRNRSHRDVSGGRGGEAEATVKERPEVPLEALFADAPTDGGDAPRPPDAEDKRRGCGWRWIRFKTRTMSGRSFGRAAFFGVAGIIVTRDRSAPMNATVYDVASGGVEAVPFANPANLARALAVAKKAGLWVLGASEHAERDLRDVDRRPLVGGRSGQ